MYGEEYCASVIGCMFSIFRCIVGECTTKGHPLLCHSLLNFAFRQVGLNNGENSREVDDR